jgi:hypothetical protein
MEAAQKPRLPAPDPDPPTSQEAARILAGAWAEDPEWGLLVWMLLVTGARRGEVLALRWENVDLESGVLTIRHSVSQLNGVTTIKGTKTHQTRRIALDAETVALLTEHRAEIATRLAELGERFDEQRFVFSYQPDHSRPCNPSGVSHRYARMVAKLGIRTHLHAMRHYSATELLASGVDLRTVAGRLGHGSGGATTSRSTPPGSPAPISRRRSYWLPGCRARGRRRGEPAGQVRPARRGGTPTVGQWLTSAGRGAPSARRRSMTTGGCDWGSSTSRRRTGSGGTTTSSTSAGSRLR